MAKFIDIQNKTIILNRMNKSTLNEQKNKKSIKRIAMIGHKRIPSREGGVEIVVEELSSRLASKGYKVDAYNRSGYHVSGKEFDTTDYKEYKGIKIITIPTIQNGKLNAIVYSFLATIRSLFAGYDVYHFHAEGPCFFLWIPHLFRRHIIVTIHGLDWQRSKWGGFATKVLLHGEKSAVRYADEIIVLSKNVQQYFKDTYNRDTHFVPNGISKPEFKEAKEMTEKWGINPQDYILFLARLVPEKGLDYLVEAFSKIKTDKKLVIAGGGSHSVSYVESIHEKAKGDDRVIFTNFVQGRKLEELYSNAYIFVLPSDVEGMAISLLEAMSYGNCCVVSDIPENTEVVGDCALTFKKSNVEDLQRVLTKLLENDDLVQEYKAKASDFICNKYNWDSVVDETLELYSI